MDLIYESVLTASNLFSFSLSIQDVQRQSRKEKMQKAKKEMQQMEGAKKM